MNTGRILHVLIEGSIFDIGQFFPVVQEREHYILFAAQYKRHSDCRKPSLVGPVIEKFPYYAVCLFGRGFAEPHGQIKFGFHQSFNPRARLYLPALGYYSIDRCNIAQHAPAIHPGHLYAGVYADIRILKITVYCRSKDLHPAPVKRRQENFQMITLDLVRLQYRIHKDSPARAPAASVETCTAQGRIL